MYISIHYNSLRKDSRTSQKRRFYTGRTMNIWEEYGRLVYELEAAMKHYGLVKHLPEAHAWRESPGKNIQIIWLNIHLIFMIRKTCHLL